MAQTKAGARARKPRSDAVAGTLPTKVADLKPAPYNARQLGEEAASGLRFSMEEFGDISGIVYNVRTGHLVAGHQRLAQLPPAADVGALKERKDQHGTIGVAAIRHGGTEWPVRCVDWHETKEKAASLAANDPALQGTFTEEVALVVEQVEEIAPDLWDGLLLKGITIEEVPGAADGEVRAEEPGEDLAKMELQPYEHYDYVLVLARNTMDWHWLCEKLGLKRMNSSTVPGKKKVGLGRAIDAGKLIKLLGGKPQ